jgi:hypothetical protein
MSRYVANIGQDKHADDRSKSYTEADTSVYFPTSFDSEPTDMNERVGNQKVNRHSGLKKKIIWPVHKYENTTGNTVKLKICEVWIAERGALAF